MKQLVGSSLLAIGSLHVVFSLVRFRLPLLEIVENGVVAGAHTPEQFGAFWFLVAGPLMVLCGISVRAQEATGSTPGPLFGWTLLATAVLGVAVFPVSGFWLLLLPGILAMRTGKTGAAV